VLSSKEFAYDQIPVYVFSTGYPGDLERKRETLVRLALTNQKGLEQYTYKPFNISELMTSSISELNQSMSYKLLSMAR
jgi:hypothetical protein